MKLPGRGMKSLESRLHLGLGTALVVLMIAFWWLGYGALQDSAEAFVSDNQQHTADALVGQLASARPQKGRLLVVEELAPVYHQPYSGHYYVILTGSGDKVLSRSLWDQDLEVEPLAPGQIAIWRTSGPDGQHLLVRSQGYHLQGQDITLALGDDISPFEQELTAYQWRFGLLALATLLVMTLVRHWIVHRVFRSLQPVYANIEQVEHGQAARLTEEVPAEMLPLVKKLNNLLTLLAERLERSRKAAANLAHGLNGRLALLRQSLETDYESQERLLNLVTEISQLADRELRRARLAGSGPPGKRFDPSEDLPELILLLERIYVEKELTLDYGIQVGGALGVDREDMLELLGVLLDNACKWARHRVSCLILAAENDLIFRIEDDGPGCADQDLERIRERGARLDEQVGGHGLGLSIAGDIVANLSGELILGSSSALGGFLAEVRLPGKYWAG